jgi:hypothetical protein
MRATSRTWPTELVCDHHSAGGPVVTAVRGTMLVSSVSTIRELGLYERYLACLPAPMRDQVLFTLAMSWSPVEVALAHYEACDRMGLRDEEISEIGARVSGRFASTFLGTLLGAARTAGMEAPWMGLRAQPRSWDRMFVGGGARIERVGPKDVIGTFTGLPLARIRYYRQSFCGYYRGLAKLFGHQAHVKVLGERGDSDTLTISGSWV